MKMEQIEGSETSPRTIQTVGNHPNERTQRSEHGESFKSGISNVVFSFHESQKRGVDPDQEKMRNEEQMKLKKVTFSLEL